MSSEIERNNSISLETFLNQTPYAVRQSDVKNIIENVELDFFVVSRGTREVPQSPWSNQREISVPKRVAGLLVIEGLPCKIEAFYTNGLVREIDYLRGGPEKFFTRWNVHEPRAPHNVGIKEESSTLDESEREYVLSILRNQASNDSNNNFQEELFARKRDYIALLTKWKNDPVIRNKYSAAVQIICEILTS